MMKMYGLMAVRYDRIEFGARMDMVDLESPYQLSDHLYVVYAEHPHVDSGNVYLITGAEPTLIDCGSEHAVPRIVSNLAQLGLAPGEVDQVIATHADYDHIQGFHGLQAQNPDLCLRINRADLPVMREANAYRTASYVYGRPYQRLDDGCLLPFDAGDTIPAGDGALEVIATPGHTEGSVCLIGDIDGRAVLFAGDTVGGAMRSLEGASLEAWVEAARAWTASLKGLSARNFDWVLNGHEPLATLPITRERFDRMVRRFGTMLNPWFSLGEREPSPA
jgi:glyoxylase-like metal-dependent hydrolase (beta-lactamase superfamily II)